MANNRTAKASRASRGLTTRRTIAKRCYTWFGKNGREIRSYFDRAKEQLVIRDHSTGEQLDQHHVRSYINATRLAMALAKSVR